MEATDDQEPYEVFARHSREPELHHVGQVRARDSRDAVVFAYTLYDERRWDEMFVVAAVDVRTLIAPE